MKTVQFNTKQFGILDIDVFKGLTISTDKHSVKSWNVHKAMVWKIIKDYSKEYGKPSDIYCGFEDDRGVTQFIVTCNFPNHWMHLRQDFFTLFSSGKPKLKMFINCHKLKQNA